MADDSQAHTDAGEREATTTDDADYGWPRVTVELANRGMPANHKKIESMMAERDIVARRHRRRRSLTKRDEAAPEIPDLVGRPFDPTTWITPGWASAPPSGRIERRQDPSEKGTAAVKLTTINNVSVDGYIEDEHGSFDWTAPDDEYYVFITDLVRSVGTYLYGRRLYETMAVWETDPTLAAQSELRAEFANAWQAADKVVYSTTLKAAATAKTRLEHSFDPDSVRDMKASATSDLTVGGPNLAAHAFKAGLVDECHLFVHPVVVGRGKPALPNDMRAELELLDERRFSSGVMYLRYRILV